MATTPLTGKWAAAVRESTPPIDKPSRQTWSVQERRRLIPSSTESSQSCQRARTISSSRVASPARRIPQTV